MSSLKAIHLVLAAELLLDDCLAAGSIERYFFFFRAASTGSVASGSLTTLPVSAAL